MIRSLSSVGFIPEKEDMLMNPTAVGRLLLGWACSDYLEVAPFGPARPVRATPRFPHVANAWSSAQHLLSGRQEILCPRNFAILRRKGFGKRPMKLTPCGSIPNSRPARKMSVLRRVLVPIR
jgi:hypothetical protein